MSENRCLYRLSTTDGAMEEQQTWNRKTGQDGQVITVNLITIYNKASSLVELHDEDIPLIVGDTVEEYVNGDTYGLELERAGDIASRWVEIDGNRLTRKTNINGVHPDDFDGFYRSVVKWSQEEICHSSGSESNSDSDCDEEKLKKHKWFFVGSKLIYNGPCKLSKLGK